MTSNGLLLIQTGGEGYADLEDDESDATYNARMAELPASGVGAIWIVTCSSGGERVVFCFFVGGWSCQRTLGSVYSVAFPSDCKSMSHSVAPA